jgi:hypothetical protein
MYRFRLIDAETASDLGPFVSHRLIFRVGESLMRAAGEWFELREIVPAENENFRAYLVVQQLQRHVDGQAQDPR